MANKGRSEPGFFGGYNHYDEHGKKIGHSSPGLLGGYTDYDSKGKKIGHSSPSLFGGYNHYDNNGHKTGHSDLGLFGGYTHYNSDGKKTGSSDPGIFGSYNHSDSQGCYIATCVYGSYDCPEVWTLRRFRDECLRRSAFGRAFIRVYYALSPTVVKWFGGINLFRSFWRRILDRAVNSLHTKGYVDTPYQDRRQC